jgi:hypothetical protein
MAKEGAYDDDVDPPSWYRRRNASLSARKEAAGILKKVYDLAIEEKRFGSAEAYAYQLNDLGFPVDFEKDSLEKNDE